MRDRIRRHVANNVVGYVALVVAVAGVPMAWALGKNSVGPRQIQPSAVRSSEVKNEAIKGVDVNEGTLGKVASAGTADSATNAQNAQSALTAENAATAGSAQTAHSADSAQTAESAASAQNANQLDGLDSSAFAPATAASSDGPISVDDPPSGGNTNATLFTVGPFTITRQCADGGATRNAGITLTSSQNGGHYALVGVNPGGTVVGTENVVDDIGVFSLTGTGNTANPDLAESTVTLLTPGGEARKAILYAGANILGTDCVFGHTLFRP